MTMKLPIYMDYHATTPVDPRVVDAMLPYFTTHFGNSASRNHAFGWEAEEAVETARRQVADLIGANPKEIIFTSGATESNNLAIKGVAEMYREKGNHVITAVTEHKAVIDTCKKLEKLGGRVTYLPVQKDGRIDLDDLRAAITDKTILITIMTANNEIGVLQPVAEIGAIAKEKGILFHTDAVQSVGKVPVNVEEMGIDLLSLSGHKMYAPKGIGALYVRKKDPRVRLEPQIDGGGHERGMRSGTLPVPSIVGLGVAAEIARNEMPEESNRLIRLRERFGQPRPWILHASPLGAAQMVDAQPRDDGGEVRARRAHVGVLVLTRTKPRVLQDVVGFAGAAEHPVGNREQQRSIYLERRSVPLHHCHGSGRSHSSCLLDG